MSLGDPFAWLEHVKQDREHGAVEVARRAARGLLELLESSTGETRSRADLRHVARALWGAQPSMAPLLHLLQVLLATDGPPDRVREAIQGYLAALESAPLRLARMAFPLFGSEATVVTCSASGSVLQALRYASRRCALRVICSDGAPMGEGRALAAELAAEEIPVTLVVDAALPALVAEATVVLVGADALTVNGLLNKVGTFPLALAARHYGVPFFVLAGSLKRWPAVCPLPRVPDHDPAEVWADSPEEVEVVNRYFEYTPWTLVDGVVMEEGIWSAEEVVDDLRAMTVAPEVLEIVQSAGGVRKVG